MGKYFTAFVVVFVVSGLALVGCGTKQAVDSQSAIQNSQDLATVQEKSDYLIGQAYAFIENDDYKEAIKIAEYVLSDVDRNSNAAQQVLKTARSEWMKVTEGEAGEIQTILTGIGEE